MNKKGKKKALIGNGTLIGAAVAALLIIFLLNPNWLPFSEKTTSKIAELEKANFLIERSGQITLAHWLTLLLAICVIWLLYTIGKLVLGLIGRRNVRARTITTMFTGGLKYLAVIAGVVWGLRILGVDTTAILAGIGIIGLILGFGAQSLIEDVITGLFIIFEGKYSIGDIIVLDDFRGIVRDIGVRTTTIEDAGYNLKVVNNSDIRNFQNRSRNTSLAVCLCSVAQGPLSRRAALSRRARAGRQRRRAQVRGGRQGGGYLRGAARAQPRYPRPLCRQGRGDPLPAGRRPQRRQMILPARSPVRIFPDGGSFFVL